MTPELLREFTRKADLHATAGKDLARCCSNNEAVVLYTAALLMRPHAIFECGTAIGWSSMWLAAGANSDEHHRHVPSHEWNIPVYSFDLAERTQYFSHPNVQKIIGDYREKIETFASPFRGKKKLFFIDGDHSYTGVEADFNATLPFLEPDDKIIFHDIISEKGSHAFDDKLQNLAPYWRREEYKTYNGIVVYSAR